MLNLPTWRHGCYRSVDDGVSRPAGGASYPEGEQSSCGGVATTTAVCCNDNESIAQRVHSLPRSRRHSDTLARPHTVLPALQTLIPHQQRHATSTRCYSIAASFQSFPTLSSACRRRLCRQWCLPALLVIGQATDWCTVCSHRCPTPWDGRSGPSVRLSRPEVNECPSLSLSSSSAVSRIIASVAEGYLMSDGVHRSG